MTPHGRSSWRSRFHVDPLPRLVSSTNEALRYQARRNLLDDTDATPEAIREIPVVRSYLHRQQPDGSWRYPGGGKAYLRSSENYDQIETYRILTELVEKYVMDRTHPSIENATEYFFSVQTDEGDFRGIYGTQYTPNYSAGIMELLIKAGYAKDARIGQGFRWLLSMRQHDGGWAIPVRTRKIKFSPATLQQTEVVKPDRDRPFSHLVTGVVLRAFAAHPVLRGSPEANHAGKLLASRLFKTDPYPDRHTVEYWEHVSFPFWFTDAVSALDSLSLVGFSAKNQEVADALTWFEHRQKPDGSFNLRIVRGRDPDSNLWIRFAICRIFKRFYGD